MKARHIVLAALAAAVTLTSVASARPDATKQRVVITVTILPSGKGVLSPLKDGALRRDSGTFGGDWSPTPNRTVVRDGQKVNIHAAVWMFTGKGGTLVFRERQEWVDLGHDQNRDGFDDGIAIGTWKVVRGTGRYAGIQEAGGVATWGSVASGSRATRASSPSRSAPHKTRPVGCRASPRSKHLSVDRDRRGRFEGFRMNKGIAVTPSCESRTSPGSA